MLRGRGSWVGLSTRLKHYRIEPEKTESSAVAQNSETESVISRYDETYKKLDKLDFVTAAKILFSAPPKKNKFWVLSLLDWHIVQFIIVCLPSLAVYLVAQYARRKMKIVDAVSFHFLFITKLISREKEEAEKKALEEEAATKSQDELMEMKQRLRKIEETINEIVLEAKKPAPSKTQGDQIY
ncbi:PREDICTED: uncharacterized protein LOC106334297 [Brassica oleracea var. oleracea]|uniref:uncharacterized protein LOC106334297 n=1 Tax=Brassica oleracea var. oleracea TaxID=109376 RepID=UPI0006A6E699|nr:PREDICTED: uncharacterized protein LOC106334297 [Brassica oleracea var. oleracea]